MVSRVEPWPRISEPAPWMSVKRRLSADILLAGIALSEKRVNSLIKSAESILGRLYPSPKRESILLRKEVIQPHLPVRLPCYDLALLTDLTLSVFLPCGLDQRFWVLSAQVA